MLMGMFIVGLTGGIATGKSTVARIFKELGCHVVDADKIAREVVEPHQPAWNSIVKNFGREILLPSEQIDREKLGKIVFEDSAKRCILNNCTHPAIYKSILWKLVKCFLTGEKFVILDLPLLFESGAVLYLMKDVVVVYCDQATQVRRLMDRNNFIQKEAEQRINAQMSLDEKCRRASYVIDNSGTHQTTEEQVNRLYEKFSKSYAYLPLRIGIFLIVFLLTWLLFYVIGLHSS